jgi:hypothetical protein
MGHWLEQGLLTGVDQPRATDQAPLSGPVGMLV